VSGAKLQRPGVVVPGQGCPCPCVHAHYHAHLSSYRMFGRSPRTGSVRCPRASWAQREARLCAGPTSCPDQLFSGQPRVCVCVRRHRICKNLKCFYMAPIRALSHPAALCCTHAACPSLRVSAGSWQLGASRPGLAICALWLPELDGRGTSKPSSPPMGATCTHAHAHTYKERKLRKISF